MSEISLIVRELQPLFCYFANPTPIITPLVQTEDTAIGLCHFPGKRLSAYKISASPVDQFGRESQSNRQTHRHTDIQTDTLSHLYISRYIHTYTNSRLYEKLLKMNDLGNIVKIQCTFHTIWTKIINFAFQLVFLRTRELKVGDIKISLKQKLFVFFL